ncbi:MAG: hypothetical protein QXH51_06150 [Candidatus Bathyarchaeia archaeon]
MYVGFQLTPVIYMGFQLTPEIFKNTLVFIIYISAAYGLLLSLPTRYYMFLEELRELYQQHELMGYLVAALGFMLAANAIPIAGMVVEPFLGINCFPNIFSVLLGGSTIPILGAFSLRDLIGIPLWFLTIGLIYTGVRIGTAAIISVGAFSNITLFGRDVGGTLLSLIITLIVIAAIIYQITNFQFPTPPSFLFKLFGG